MNDKDYKPLERALLEDRPPVRVTVPGGERINALDRRLLEIIEILKTPVYDYDIRIELNREAAQIRNELKRIRLK